MNIVIFRRRGYSSSSLRLLADKIREQGDHTVRTWMPEQSYSLEVNRDLLIRWGYFGHTPSLEMRRQKWINVERGGVSFNKGQMRSSASRLGMCESSGFNVTFLDDYIQRLWQRRPEQLVVRPATHSGGLHFRVCPCEQSALLEAADEVRRLSGMDDIYFAPFFPKTREFRVFVLHNRIVNVYERFPGNPEDYVWNHANGGTVKNLKWGDWNLDMCRKSISLMHGMGQDFGALDWMMDAEGNTSFLEINRAPALEGEYRALSLAKALLWYPENGYQTFERPGSQHNNWRDVIHPAVGG